MKKIIIAIILLLCPLIVKAENWQHITDGENGDILYVDKDSIKVYGDYVYYWTKILIKNKRNLIDQYSYFIKNKKVIQIKDYAVVNCTNNSSASVSTIWYGLQLNVLSSRTINQLMNPNNITYESLVPDIPESTGKIVDDYACNTARLGVY